MRSMHLIKIDILILTITLLSGIILASSTTSADVVDDVVVTVPISCNMSSELDEAHTATINPGQYQSDIGTTNFTVFCNDNSGYAIYAIGYSNEEYGNTKMLATINNQLSPTNDINTGTTISGSTSAWAMKLIPVTTASSGTTQPYTPTIESDTNGSYENYHIVPEEYTKVATLTSNTDFTIGSSLQSTYQVYIDGTKPAGTYAGKVKYTLVHPNDAAAPTLPVTINDIEFMQDLATLTTEQITSLKDSMTEDAQYQLKDSRDNKTYYVAKLRDGNIWMTQNLDLDLESTPTNVAPLTSENTDLPANTTWTPSTATYISSDTTWVWSTTAPESYDPGNYYWNGVFSGYEGDTTDWEDCAGNTQCYDRLFGIYTDSTGIAQRHLGNYYNFAASVGMNDASTYTTHGELINQSICPSGWTLPRVGTGEDTFFALLKEYGFSFNQYNLASLSNDSILWNSPLYYSNSGSYNGDIWGVGLATSLRSCIVNNNTFSYSAHFGASDYTNLGHSFVYNSRAEGSPIRCIARPVTNTIEGLQ